MLKYILAENVRITNVQVSSLADKSFISVQQVLIMRGFVVSTFFFFFAVFVG